MEIWQKPAQEIGSVRPVSLCGETVTICKLPFVIATLGLEFMKARWRDGALPEDDLTGSASAVTGPLKWVLTRLDVQACRAIL